MRILKIRYNNNYPLKSKFQWRIIENNITTFVNGVRIDNCNSYTTSEFIEGEGEKHHITVECNLLNCINSADKIIAYIK